MVLNESGRALVANGMIYNYRELRGTLPSARFRTDSDSEVILHGYAAYGAEAVAQLDGMFAFVLTDGESVLAARDPIGIKPLYVGRRPDGLCFASEIKALVGNVDEIEEFPPGHYYHSKQGFVRYYEVPDGSPSIFSPEEAVQAVRTVLERAVAKRLRSDVPLGAFLSGGLDSSIITALALRHVDDLHTFAVGLEGSRDLVAARRVAEHLGTIHHEYVLTRDEVIEALPHILYHLESYDRDLVRSAVPCYFVSRLAAERVKVVLTGEGADELFAGYAYYKDYRNARDLHIELRRSVTAMHNVNLQRVDRMTMAHGLEGRVPFLDKEMIALASRIDPALKLRRLGGRSVEKWILRHAFQDLLPHEIVWRDKEQFDQGSGVSSLLVREAARQVAEGRIFTLAGEDDGGGPRSPEEAWYRKLLSQAFTPAQPVLDLVAHWTTDRTDRIAA